MKDSIVYSDSYLPARSCTTTFPIPSENDKNLSLKYKDDTDVCDFFLKISQVDLLLVIVLYIDMYVFTQVPCLE
jgi:hypothetical protein